MNKTLNNITQELITAHVSLELSQGEVDEKLEADLARIETELAEKTDHYVYRIEKLEQSLEFWKSKAKQAREVASSIKAHIDAMKERIKSTMVQLDTKEIKGEMYKFTVRPTAKLKINIVDESLIPVYLKILEQKLVVNKELIREKIEQGEAVQGVSAERSLTLSVGVNK